MKNVAEIITDVADTLREAPPFSGVPVIEEDKGNVIVELEKRISEKSISVVVGWNGFTPTISGETAPDGKPFGLATIVVQVYERPFVNRKIEGAKKLLDLAREAAIMLDGAASDGMGDTLHLVGISPVSAPKPGYITCDVEFRTKTTL